MFTNLAHALLRYTIIKDVGDGTFGSVWRAINKVVKWYVILLAWSLLLLHGCVVCYYHLINIHVFR
jgi:hypothetical protein